MAGSDAKDKRQTIRIQPFVTPCKVIDGETRYVGYLTDLSTRGARVSCDSPLPAGAQAVVLEVRLARSAGTSRLPARIQWMQAGTQAGEAVVFGVTFDGVDAEQQATLESVVADFQRRAALLG